MGRKKRKFVNKCKVGFVHKVGCRHKFTILTLRFLFLKLKKKKKEKRKEKGAWGRGTKEKPSHMACTFVLPTYHVPIHAYIFPISPSSHLFTCATAIHYNYYYEYLVYEHMH